MREPEREWLGQDQAFSLRALRALRLCVIAFAWVFIPFPLVARI